MNRQTAQLLEQTKQRCRGLEAERDAYKARWQHIDEWVADHADYDRSILAGQITDAVIECEWLYPLPGEGSAGDRVMDQQRAKVEFKTVPIVKR